MSRGLTVAYTMSLSLIVLGISILRHWNEAHNPKNRSYAVLHCNYCNKLDFYCVCLCGLGAEGWKF